MNKFALFFIIIFGSSCTSPTNRKTVVDFADTVSLEQDTNDVNSKIVYIAIASITSPKETYTYYDDLIKYISEKVGHRIFIKQKKTYEEVNMLLENSEVDFAFICSGAFVNGYSKGKIKLLVAPEIDGKVTYQSYIIAQKKSGINKFDDFRNKSFAFTDPLSNTGRMYPSKKLALLKTNDKDFFSKSIYTYGHDVSIQMVNRGIIDGAAVHSLIFNYIKFYHPERVKNIKIIDRSVEFGMPPVVVPTTLPEKCFKKYQKVFLNIHNDSIGKKILDKLNIDKFVVVDDTIYKSVFQLKELIDDEAKN